MSAFVYQDLPMSVGCDAQFMLTVTSANANQIAISGATAQMSAKGTTLDATPLFTISTTASLYGQLVFGVGLPAPTGANCATFTAVLELGTPPTVSLLPPSPVLATAASIAAMAALNTTSILSGTVCLVEAGNGSYFAWSPADAGTPNGTTIVVNTGTGPTGNWLLCTTVTITITALAAATLAGFDQAFFDLLILWGNGTTTKFVSGKVLVDQTETA